MGQLYLAVLTGLGPAALAAQQMDHQLLTVAAVSYTHLDVYKRQISSFPARTFSRIARALGFMSVWSAATSSVAVPPQVGFSTVTRAAMASSTGSGGSVPVSYTHLDGHS